MGDVIYKISNHDNWFTSIRMGKLREFSSQKDFFGKTRIMTIQLRSQQEISSLNKKNKGNVIYSTYYLRQTYIEDSCMSLRIWE